MPRRRHNPYDYFLLYKLIRGRNGCDKELYRKFLNILCVPPSCGGINAASFNFLRGMDLIRKYRWPEYKELSEIVPVAEAILQLTPEDITRPHPRARHKSWWTDTFWEKGSGGVRHGIPAIGYQQEYPVYPPLYQEQLEELSEGSEEAYRLLSMHLICANLFLLSSVTPAPNPSRFQNISMWMKELSLAINAVYLNLVPLKRSPEKLANCWLYKGVGESALIREDLEAARKIEVLNSVLDRILEARNLQSPSEHGGGGGGTRSNQVMQKIRGFHLTRVGHVIPKSLIGDDEDVPELFSVSIAPEDLLVDEGEDIHPAETRAAELVYVAGGGSDTRTGPFTSKHQLNHVDMANQRLPYEFNNLTIAEMALIMEMASEWFRVHSEAVEQLLQKVSVIKDEHIDGLKKHLNRMRFVVVLMVQVWLGRDRIRAKNIRYSTDASSLVQGDILQLLDMEGDLYWRFNVVKPSSNPLSLVRVGEQREVAEHFLLPDYFGFGNYYLRLRDLIFRARGEETPVFAHWTDQDYKINLKTFFYELNERHKTFLAPTETHLSRFIKNHMQFYGFDDVDAALLFEYKYSGTDTQLHYYTPEISVLADCYRQVVKKAIEDIDQEWPGTPRDKPRKVKERKEITGAVGVHQCPTKSSVREMATWLQHSIKENAGDDEHRHNFYTANYIGLTAYTTSFRSVVTPIPIDDWIDEELLVAVLSDKDGLAKNGGKPVDSYFNARHVPLTKTYLKQYQFYKDHLQKVCERGLIDVASVNEEAQKILADQSPFYLFGGQVLPCRPSLTEEILSPVFGFKLNSNRRFLRTELRAMGVPPEFVDAYMSHWAWAQEPWGKYSTLPYGRYLQEVRFALETLTNDCGWIAIQSPFRRSL